MRVLNARNFDSVPHDAIYVGRPGSWGNPFNIGPDGTRRQVIDKFWLYITNEARLLNRLHELVDRDLICWCAPEACHANVLAELAACWKEQYGDAGV